MCVRSEARVSYKDDEGVRFRPGLPFQVSVAPRTSAYMPWGLQVVVSGRRQVVCPQYDRARSANGAIAAPESLWWWPVQDRLVYNGVGMLVSLGLWDHVAAD